jgi:hypothetical protein
MLATSDHSTTGGHNTLVSQQQLGPHQSQQVAVKKSNGVKDNVGAGALVAGDGTSNHLVAGDVTSDNHSADGYSYDDGDDSEYDHDNHDCCEYGCCDDDDHEHDYHDHDEDCCCGEDCVECCAEAGDLPLSLASQWPFNVPDTELMPTCSPWLWDIESTP